MNEEKLVFWMVGLGMFTAFLAGVFMGAMIW
jgi:hypothetical protein